MPRTKKIPERIFTEELNKARLRINRIRKDDPRYKAKVRDILSTVAESIWYKAEKGDKWAIEFLYDRVVGKPKQVNENIGQIDHKHTGFKITFEAPQKGQGMVIDQAPEKLQ